MWIRVDVVRMFVEHTSPHRQSTQSADAKYAFLLWKVNPIFHFEHYIKVRLHASENGMHFRIFGGSLKIL